MTFDSNDNLFKRDEYRLILVMGPAGSGKSDLARRTLSHRQDVFWAPSGFYKRADVAFPDPEEVSVVVMFNPQGAFDKAVVRQTLAWCKRNRKSALVLVRDQGERQRLGLAVVDTFLTVSMSYAVPHVVITHGGRTLALPLHRVTDDDQLGLAVA